MSTGELSSLNPIQVQLCYFGKDQDTPQHSQRVFHNTSIETQLFVFTCIYMHIVALNLPDHSPKLSPTSECIMSGIWQNKPRLLQQNKMLCAFENEMEHHVPMPTDARCRAHTTHTHRQTNKQINNAHQMRSKCGSTRGVNTVCMCVYMCVCVHVYIFCIYIYVCICLCYPLLTKGHESNI